MNTLYNYFENVFKEDKIVQSYLIGNTKFDDIKEELYEVLKKYFFENKKKLEENPDLYVLKINNGNISKDDIVNLIKNINTTSQFNNKKVYIIDECERLNDYAFNAILKTLEEPNPNVYAFLITKNMESVKPTILSRCQKIFVSSEVRENNMSEEIITLGDELINNVEKYKINTISNFPQMYNKIIDKECFKNILLYIQNKYIDELNNGIFSNIINENEIELLSKKILVINNNINLLNNNLNKNLSIDRFIIEMWRCNNENS